MCGIVGYTGKKQAADIIIDGLKRLEYRGYDSSGIAVISDDKVHIERSKGKLMELVKVIAENKPIGCTGIGHTRWATHGRPSEENAHPHTDCSGNIVVVHNGIIENYLKLKKELMAAGHIFKSETDTEVIAHTIEKNFNGDLLEAVKKTLKEVEGAYAIGVVASADPDKIIAAKKDAPLILGAGKNENFIASDIPALLPYTRDMIFLEDGDIAMLTSSAIKVFDKSEKEVKRKINNITWDALMAEKGGFKHFMLKEIFEQPRTMQETFRGRIYPEESATVLDEVSISEDIIKGISKAYIVACGTSYHAGLVGKFLLESIAKLPAEVDIASEFRYREAPLEKNSIAIVISQSGETADTIAALKLVKEAGIKTLAICNVIGSSISRLADANLYTRCGPEIGVASTKAFTGQLTALYLLAFDWAKKRGSIDKPVLEKLVNEFWEIPVKAEEVLKQDADVLALAKKFFRKRDFLYLGRNINYPIALEGALKLKEISYIHAEGYPAGEMKHGPIALIDSAMPVMVIATDSKVYEKVMGNIEEAKARGGTVIALASEGNKDINAKVENVIFVARTSEIFTPLLNVIPLQLFSYHVSVLLGCDVDQPRNLAKSVTVE